MKQVFASVRPRRLGQRGSSKYCYSGLKKRSALDPPSLPDLGEPPPLSRSEVSYNLEFKNVFCID